MRTKPAKLEQVIVPVFCNMYSQNYLQLFAALLCIVTSTSLLSAQPVVDLLPVHSQNHISENASRKMLKDDLGYIWIGTIDGLNRYDGHRYQIYQHKPWDSTSISGNYITDLLQDRQGNIWVGTFSGLNLYDRSRDCFISFSADSTDVYAIQGTGITDLVEGADGSIWIGSYEGLSRWDPREERFHNIPLATDSISSDGLLSHKVTALSVASDGGLWIGYDDHSLSYYNNSIFQHYFPVFGASDHILTKIRDIHILSDNRFLIASRNACYLFDLPTGVLEKKLEGRIWDIINLDDQTIIANVNFDGVYQWNQIESSFEKISVRYQGEDVDGDIRFFFRDERNILWATYQGLAKEDDFEQRFKHHHHQKGNLNSLIDDRIVGITGDSSGNVWIASQNQGLCLFRTSTKSWHHHLNDIRFDNILNHVILGFNIYLDKASIWLAGRYGLYRYDIGSGHVSNYVFPESDQMDGIGNFYRDRNNTLWLGSDSKIYKYDPGSDTWSPLEIAIKFLFEDKEGQLFGISRWHIYQFDSVSRSFQPIAEIPSISSTIPETVSCIAQDNYGNLWIGKDFGLVKYDPARDSFRIFTIRDGLPNHNVNSILTDDQQNLWISTNRGLARFDQSTGQFHAYDISDGLQSEIFLPRAAWKAPDGTMYFGGVQGLNIFHPQSLESINPYPPDLHISALRIFNKIVEPAENGPLSQPIWESSEVSLSYNDRTISFDLHAFGYTQPHKNQYAYMIEGIDQDWNYTSTGRTASYTGLPRGQQLVFKAKSANHDGVWNEKPVILRIYIRPPFWELAGFQLLLLSILIGGMIGLYRYRVRAVKLSNQRLEDQVQEQTAEIKQQAKMIQQKAAKLDRLNRAQSQFYTGLTHEFRTPLTLLLAYLDIIKSPDRDKQHIREAIAHMHFNADQLLALVDQLMDVAKLESGHYPLKVAKYNLARELHQLTNGFSLLAQKKDLDLKFICDEALLQYGWIDLDILQKILNNLISNAIKYTDQGHVWVKAKVEQEDFLYIEVHDTGIGIPQEQLDLVFDRFYRVNQEGNLYKQGTGVGLFLVKQLVELHKGTINVASDPDLGTRFWLKIPITAECYRQDEKVDVHEAIMTNQVQEEITVSPDGTAGKSSQTSGQHVDPYTILIIEDHPEILSYLYTQISENYKVITAINGKQGWEKSLKELPDIIISDIMMPEIDGFTLCEQLKSDVRTSHIPVILLTALSSQEKKIRGLETGADAYIPKPFNIQELHIRIANMLRHQKRLQQRFEKNLMPGFLPSNLSKPDHHILTRLNALIEDHLAEEQLKSDDITKALSISRTQLFRKLKSLTGMSLTEYVRDYRLRHAYQLLSQPDISVKEVIFATGFSSRSYFYRCFKKKFSMLPNEVPKRVDLNDFGTP